MCTFLAALQQHAAEELKGERDKSVEDAKPERQPGIEGWRAALAAWHHRGTAMLASHDAKARPSADSSTASAWS